MSQENTALFTIGQFAALHGINKKTLMWYDTIGLFRPAVVKKNGYRCYTHRQSSTLECILMLRELNVSIPEIAAFIQDRTPDSLYAILNEKSSEIDRTIQHLLDIQRALRRQMRELETLRTLDLSAISVVHREAQPLVTLQTTKNTAPEKEMEMLLDEMGRRRAGRMYGVCYGAMIPTASILRGDFEDYRAVFVQVPQLKAAPDLHIQPAGEYLCAHCKGSWDRLPGTYRKILRYAEENGLELWDYSYETGINETVIESMDRYITRIEIPVKPRR